MKSIIICIGLLPLILSLTVKHQANFLSIPNKEPLFTDNTEYKQCPVLEEKLEDEDEKTVIVPSIPVSKPNKFDEIKMGQGHSTYFFDFLDPLLQDKIVKEFSRIWEEAKNIELPNEKDYKDPYPLNAFLRVETNMTQDAILNIITERNHKFNKTLWNNSIDGRHIYSIVKKWKWGIRKIAYDDTAKYLVNKYDYNGDGRIDVKEFLIMMINQNRRSLDLPKEKRCINCLETITDEFINPIYDYLNNRNCTSKGLSSEQIWDGIKNLNRGTNLYDMYSCVLKEGHLRTNSVNDFVIKSMKKTSPYLTKEEFRSGIFIGYWTRQVTEDSIVLNDDINLKKYRWDGNLDRQCEKIKNSYEN